MEKKVLKEVTDWVLHIVVAILLAVCIIVFVGRITIVDGTSMAPTLKNHDILIIESISTRFGSIKPGDIVVMKIPELLEGRKKYAIKRVIAVENQLIEIKDGKVYRDGQLLIEDYINGDTAPSKEGLYDKIVVPEGCVYVMGDNRLPEKSRDSRTFGPVSKQRIIGKVFLRIFPFSEIGLIEQ